MTYTELNYENEIATFEKKYGKDTMLVSRSGEVLTKEEFYEGLMSTFTYTTPKTLDELFGDLQ